MPFPCVTDSRHEGVEAVNEIVAVGLNGDANTGLPINCFMIHLFTFCPLGLHYLLSHCGFMVDMCPALNVCIPCLKLWTCRGFQLPLAVA